MKYAVAITSIALLAALGLSGCAGAKTLPESEHFDMVRERESFAPVDDAQLRQFSADICEVLEEVPEPDGYMAILDVYLDNGYDAGDTGAFIAFSVAQYCPEQREKIPLE